MTKMKEWMDAAPPDLQGLLAKRVKTTRAYLYQLSGGTRKASSDMAGRIEKASDVIRTSHPELPRLTRGDLSETCATCPYLKQCSKVTP